MKKLLVIGASGLLGSYNVKHALGTNFDIFGTYATKKFVMKDVKSFRLDITNEKEVDMTISNIKPDCIILTSAQTKVDHCERHPKEAELVNVKGVEYVARVASDAGSKLVYISTDYVFDGEKGNYSEDDEPNPVSVYGKTKFEGELTVKKYCEDYLIGRVCVVYGWSPPNRKSNLVEWIIKSLKAGKEIQLVDDQFGTPTYTASATRLLFGLIDKDKRGIYHISGKDCVNRYEMGLRIAEIFGLNGKNIKASKLSDMKFAAKRPKNSCLKTIKVEKELNIRMRSFVEDLQAMKDEQRTVIQ